MRLISNFIFHSFKKKEIFRELHPYKCKTISFFLTAIMTPSRPFYIIFSTLFLC